MKVGKKEGQTRTRFQTCKKKLTFVMHALVIASLITVIGVSAFSLYSMLNPSSEGNPVDPSLQFKPNNMDSQLRAAIIDQLSLTYPNQTFVETATTILNQAGFTVDYYSGDKVTVEFFRNLATRNYSLLIFRSHSTAQGAFFTSEPYDDAHLEEQLNRYVWTTAYYRGGPTYFAISPSFITSRAKGTFNGSIIITMGCYGSQLNDMELDMAEAFIDRGAKAYIGWSGSVLAERTDLAITHLLQHIFVERLEIKEAVARTMEEIGEDPVYKSTLLALPDELHTIESTQIVETCERIYKKKGHRPAPD